MNEPFSQIYFDDINTTWAVVSSVLYAPMPGSTAFTANTNNINGYQPQKANSSSARFVVGNEGRGVTRGWWDASFTGALGNKAYHIALFKNGSKLPMTSQERKIGTAGDIGAASKEGNFVTKVNDIIDIRAEAGGSTGIVITFTHLIMGLELRSTSTADLGVV